MCTESQSVWHWSQHTRCTDSYTTGGKGGCGIPREKEEGVGDKVAGVLKKRKNQKGTPLRVVRGAFSRLLTVFPFMIIFFAQLLFSPLSTPFLSFLRHALVGCWLIGRTNLVSENVTKRSSLSVVTRSRSEGNP